MLGIRCYGSTKDWDISLGSEIGDCHSSDDRCKSDISRRPKIILAGHGFFEGVLTISPNR